MWTTRVFQRDASDQSPATGLDSPRLLVRESSGLIDIHPTCGVTVDVSMPAKRCLPMRRIAQPHRRRDQRFEHRIEIEGRPADRLEDVSGRSLLLQRLCKVPRARLHLVEQPHVLDGDDRLVGEGL